MPTAVSAQEHLQAVAGEAVAYYDRDDRAGAIACVVTRFGDHPGTADHAANSGLMLMVLGIGWDQGRAGFMKAITDFAVSG